jgi:hypothetical protein
MELARQRSGRNRILGLALIGLAALAAVLPAAGAAHPAAGKTIHLKAFVETVGFAVYHADGTPVGDPSGPPAVGDWLETSEDVYRGDHRQHASKPFATSHTICVFFTADGGPRCDSQLALGTHELVLLHTPGGHDGRTVVHGGTGRFAGVTGTLRMHTIGDTNDSDVVATLRLR